MDNATMKATHLLSLWRTRLHACSDDMKPKPERFTSLRLPIKTMNSETLSFYTYIIKICIGPSEKFNL